MQNHRDRSDLLFVFWAFVEKENDHTLNLFASCQDEQEEHRVYGFLADLST